jgi:hypothetical protein
MNRQASCISLATALVLALPASLQAQEKLNLKLSTSDDGILYQFQARLVQAGSGMDKVVGSRTGGGVGFSAVFGDTPLRLRVRMDGDAFDGKDGKGRVATEGLGAEGVLFLSSFDRVTPFISCGAAFQHWEVTQGDQVPTNSRTSNRIAGRAELGLRLGRRALVSFGVLAGKTGDGRSTSNFYLAFTY